MGCMCKYQLWWGVGRIKKNGGRVYDDELKKEEEKKEQKEINGKKIRRQNRVFGWLVSERVFWWLIC